MKFDGQCKWEGEDKNLDEMMSSIARPESGEMLRRHAKLTIMRGKCVTGNAEPKVVQILSSIWVILRSNLFYNHYGRKRKAP
jgi:hypothetical protein